MFIHLKLKHKNFLGVENKETNVNDTRKSTEPITKNTPDKEPIKQSSDVTSNLNKNTIEHYNSEAVQSIVAASNQKQPPDVKKCLNINTDSGDVILFDGNLDNYIKSSTTTSTLNGNNLLMVQPQNPETGNNILPVNSAKPRNTKESCILVSNTPTQSRVLTEQDILKMPTVILCDNKCGNPPIILPCKCTYR